MQSILYCRGQVAKEQPLINIEGNTEQWDPISLDEYSINARPATITTNDEHATDHQATRVD